MPTLPEVKHSAKPRPAVSALLAGLTLAATFSAAPAARAGEGLNVYVSAPAVSTETYTGAQVESFSSFAVGSFTNLASTGLPSGTTYSGTGGSIINGGNYAASTGSGNYLAVSAGGTVTLTLGTAEPYFGLALSAVDGGNTFSFYDANGGLIGTFNAGTATALLPNNTTSTVTSNDGKSTYHTNLYYGQPNTATPPTATTTNNGEPYAFLHFIGQTYTANGQTLTTAIKTIVFKQTSTGGNLESDNHTILTSAPAADGSFVFVSSVVPEPGVGATIAAGCVGMLALGRLRRRVR